ncbi:Molybdopterin-binding protein [Hyphomicrobiales bacterium]|nr:Molybdopterin-binding protein [Hyphomicrobiales bacterium]
MKFSTFPVRAAIGAIAAHTVRGDRVILKKGSLISAEIAEWLEQAGIDTIMAAFLDHGDVGENEAAWCLARALTGTNLESSDPFTGRANIVAECPGILVVNKATIDEINRIDESMTVATLAPYLPVQQGELVGTVKIIPYAVPGALLDRALACADQNALSIAPYTLRKVTAISTLLPGLKSRTVDSTLDVLAKRLETSGARIVADRRIPHAREALVDELVHVADGETELIIIFGASAIADRRDVIPNALEFAGGRVEHLGMPVDPGNLLLVGAINGKPVIGAPGCARSPKENGFDWVLQRMLAGLPVTRTDIVSMGVGGLLKEIVSRPQRRLDNTA